MSDNRDHYRHDPNSMDSMFTRILERLDAQDRMHLNGREEQGKQNKEIIQKLDGMDARTTLLEQRNLVRDTRTGMISGAAAMIVSVAVWIVEHFTNKN